MAASQQDKTVHVARGAMLAPPDLQALLPYAKQFYATASSYTWVFACLDDTYVVAALQRMPASGQHLGGGTHRSASTRPSRRYGMLSAKNQLTCVDCMRTAGRGPMLMPGQVSLSTKPPSASAATSTLSWKGRADAAWLSSGSRSVAAGRVRQPSSSVCWRAHAQQQRQLPCTVLRQASQGQGWWLGSREAWQVFKVFNAKPGGHALPKRFREEHEWKMVFAGHYMYVKQNSGSKGLPAEFRSDFVTGWEKRIHQNKRRSRASGVLFHRNNH